MELKAPELPCARDDAEDEVDPGLGPEIERYELDEEGFGRRGGVGAGLEGVSEERLLNDMTEV